MSNQNLKEMVQNLLSTQNITDLTHTKSEENILKEYIITRNPKALEYGMWRFNAAHAGHMHKDPKLNYLYMGIGSLTLLTRFAIEGGMPEARAYSISDIFLQQLHPEDSPEKITEWYRNALTMFIELMPETSQKDAVINKKSSYSRLVNDTIDYCMNHVSAPLRVNDISDLFNFTPDYISAVFKKETGITLSKFIRSIKIRTAKEMLKYTDTSISEIAYSLSYSSQSHFIRAFKEETGMTPKEYANSTRF